MSAVFVLDEKDCCSKTTSGLMGAVFHSVLGKKNDIIEGWQVNLEDLSKVLLTALELKRKPEFFQAFVEMFPDSYWGKRMKINPTHAAETITTVCDMLAETLAEMAINKTDYIYACWE